VLAEWLVDTARRCGYAAQSTSIPGVAQRTGATTYYFEVFPVPLAALEGRVPVFSLYPVPGALDVLVSSELLETARQVGNGMVSPDRTLVMTSSARTLTTAEKMPLGDGRASTEGLLQLVGDHARAVRIFDMSEVAQASGTVLSAVLFGAIAGSGVLPFPRAAFEDTIRASGRGVEASLRGFAAAFGIAQRAGDGGPVAAAPQPVAPAADWIREFPPAVHDMLALGRARMIEYQDAAYAQLYLQRMWRVLEAERAVDGGEGGFGITRETARFLALWMAFDDIVRVADLKSRTSRFARVRREAGAGDADLVRVYDHFKPGVPELAALLPESWARRALRWDRRRQQKGKPAAALPLKVGTHTVFGMLALRMLASLRGWRRRGSRYAAEQAMIERWLACVEQGTRASRELGLEVALCGRLIKGYGATNERGKENLLHVLDQMMAGDVPGEAAGRAASIRAIRTAALADEAGTALDQALLRHGAAARPVKAQPIRWMRKPRSAAS
jgi:indolepyruvate ferredoxin oxidoreductase beta subunit